jgi:hypothetical protein
MSIISSAMPWAERILQHVDGVFQPTIGTLLIRSNQDSMQPANDQPAVGMSASSSIAGRRDAGRSAG